MAIVMGCGQEDSRGGARQSSPTTSTQSSPTTSARAPQPIEVSSTTTALIRKQIMREEHRNVSEIHCYENFGLITRGNKLFCFGGLEREQCDAWTVSRLGASFQIARLEENPSVSSSCLLVRAEEQDR